MWRAFLDEEAFFDQILDVVGNVGAEVIAAVGELANGDVLTADVIQHQGLDVVYFLDLQAIQLGLDDIKEPAVQPFNQ